MKEVAVFAQTTYRNQFKKFGIKTDDRRRHMYLIGKTGMGKSTILENMIVDDIRAGHGVAVVDPHGDLAEKIIEFIPENRVDDVVYFNPSDINYPIAFNVVEQVEPHLRHLVASGLIGIFQKLWADSWGPRLEYILRNAILAILDFPGSTLLGVVRMLSDKNYRKRVVANVKDPVVKAFWEKEFSGYADKFAAEAVSPIQNKVGQFLSSSLMRNVIGQVKSAIDIRNIMDSGKILIMNLSKGRIGEDNSALLGAMMITKIQLAAMSRVDTPEKDRRDFYLYIDEFQNFSTDSFANILSEARKYRLNLILAHQYIEQLNEKVKPAVFGNVGTIIVFRVGAADAEQLVKEFTPTFTEEDIVNLPKYEMYLKLMIDGIASAPFSAAGLPPLSEGEKTGNKDKVIAYSREKYASDRETVEQKIMSWHENYDEGMNEGAGNINGANPNDNNKPKPSNGYIPRPTQTPSSPRNYSNNSFNTQNNNGSDTSPAPAPTNNVKDNAVAVKKGNLPVPPVPVSSPAGNRPLYGSASPINRQVKEGYHAICSSCGKETSTVFEPDGVRPVYCRDCLGRKKEEKRLEMEKRRVAKEEEKQRMLDEAAAASVPSISLESLRNINPVDWRGREIKTEKKTLPSAGLPKKNYLKADIEEDNEEEISSDEGNLVEGEEVTITNNKF